MAKRSTPEPGRHEMIGSPGTDEHRRATRRSSPSLGRVFVPAAVVVLAFVLYAWLATDNATSVINQLHEEVITSFGWYYVLIVAAFVVFTVIVGVSRLGDVKLGRDTDNPEFSLRSWLAMLFAAGMGIGLVFWGVAEPASHLANPRPGSVGSTGAEQAEAEPWYQDEQFASVAADAGQEAMIQSFLHWGLHPWAIYAIVGLAVGYMVHRKGRPVSIRWTLEPVLGRFVRGWVGDIIDIVAIVGTLFGVATSLGLGALQIAAGIGWVGDVEPGSLLQAALIAGITLVAIVSVVTGLHRGIKWLSNINISLMALLLLFVLIAAPTVFVAREFIQSLGLYVQNLFRLSFEVGALQGEEGQQWAADWTTFYWGWWMSWAPFVGIFIARISRGRSVRQFVAGVLLVPTLLSFVWFGVLGGAGIYRELFEGGDLAGQVDRGEEYALFGLLDGFPGGTVVIIVVLFLIGMFFITSSDSGSLVVDMLATGGDPDPPTWSRIFWAALEGAVAIALLLLAAGEEGLSALRIAAIIAALPVSVVMILMAISVWRQLQGEHRSMREAARERRTEELTEQVSQRMRGEEGYGESGPPPSEGEPGSSPP